MKRLSILMLCLLACAAPIFAQGAAGGTYLIRKIQPNIVTTPSVMSSAGPQRQTPGTAGQWVEVEVSFQASPDYTEELTLKYYVLLSNGQCLTGDVTHVDVLGGRFAAGGRDLMSVMYVSPHSLLRALGRPGTVTPQVVADVGVEIAKGDAVVDALSLKAPKNNAWWKTVPADKVKRALLNKNETPFMPLYWDRYEMIKPASAK